MTTLNLINPAASAIPFSTMLFPDGQPHIKIDTASIPANETEGTIISRISNPADLLLVLFAKSTLEYAGFEKIDLHCSYLMAARMDRVMTNGEPFSLKIVASIINNTGFNKIKIFDPHSEVSTALLDKSFTIDNILFVKDVLQDYSSKNPDDDKSLYSIVSPDAGALKKIYKVAAALDHIDVVECMKQRDLHTGKLSGFKVFEDDLSGRTCFIVDDICDGGGTFIGVAAELKKLGAAKIILLVSHGIFSKGYELAGIDAVYCTDSYKTISEEKINVFPVMRYLADA